MHEFVPLKITQPLLNYILPLCFDLGGVKSLRMDELKSIIINNNHHHHHHHHHHHSEQMDFQ